MKTVTMRVDDETYRVLRAAAAADRRSIANLIETAALRHLEETSFMDAAEAREIIADPALQRRLRQAHAQAKRRRGAFVRGL